MDKLKQIRIDKIIIWYILLQPILDVITALCLDYISPYLTFGIIVRTIFMLLIVTYSLFKVNKKKRIYNLRFSLTK